jgi:hypothetical protein
MTQREISRADIFSEISQKLISKTKASEVLGISFRHLHRLYDEFQKKGIIVLVSRHRGKPSNHQLPRILKTRISELVTCEKYSGFGPKFMCEKLKELHGITICAETTRQIMIQAGVWKAGKKKCPVIHQQRKRRARCGELIQIDGSPHAWFEERGDLCVLIVFIDDATGHTDGKFFKSETTRAYMITVWEYIIKYGRPIAFYPDKHGIFRINKPGCLRKELITQFGRVCKELDIELICANSPQAKGRVERMNQTLQDRLVKEMRLAGINNIEEGNNFLPQFWERLNEKFEVKPENKEDAHKKILPEHNLDKIFCIKHKRKVSKNLEISYKNVIYQLTLERSFNTFVNAYVTVLEGLNGQIFIEHKGEFVPFKIFSQQECMGEEINSKEINRFLDKIVKNKKSPHNHPWKQEGRAEAKIREFQEHMGGV